MESLDTGSRLATDVVFSDEPHQYRVALKALTG
jgi:hypothetical protein